MISRRGFIFAALKGRITTGPLVDTLNYFEIHLSAQVKCLLWRRYDKRANDRTGIYAKTPIIHQSLSCILRQSQTQL